MTGTVGTVVRATVVVGCVGGVVGGSVTLAAVVPLAGDGLARSSRGVRVMPARVRPMLTRRHMAPVWRFRRRSVRIDWWQQDMVARVEKVDVAGVGEPSPVNLHHLPPVGGQRPFIRRVA